MKPFTILLFAAFLLVNGCVTIKPGYFSDDKHLAEKAVVKFHDQFNRAAYDEIFESTHPDAKATKSEAKLVEVLTELRSSFGGVKSSLLATSRVVVIGANERSVEMIYKTQFEKGTRNEIFVFISDGEQARLHSIGVATDSELEEARKTAN